MPSLFTEVITLHGMSGYNDIIANNEILPLSEVIIKCHPTSK